jgi:hypothetical protein
MCEVMYGIERIKKNEKLKSIGKAYYEAIQDKEEKTVATMKCYSLLYADCMSLLFSSCNWLAILWC